MTQQPFAYFTDSSRMRTVLGGMAPEDCSRYELVHDTWFPSNLQGMILNSNAVAELVCFGNMFQFE